MPAKRFMMLASVPQRVAYGDLFSPLDHTGGTWGARGQKGGHIGRDTLALLGGHLILAPLGRLDAPFEMVQRKTARQGCRHQST